MHAIDLGQTAIELNRIAPGKFMMGSTSVLFSEIVVEKPMPRDLKNLIPGVSMT
jgi:hypothetical protein